MENILNDLNIISVCNTKYKYCVIDKSYKSPGIFIIDKETMISCFGGCIDKAKGKRIRVSCTVNYENIVLFVLRLDNEEDLFVLFDIVEKRIWYLKDINPELDFTSSFCSVLQENEKVWFFPTDIKGSLVVLNLLSQQFEIITEWKNKIGSLELNESYLPGPGKPICVDGKVYVTLTRWNYVVEIDVKTFKITLHEVLGRYDLAFSMEYDGENFWILQARNEGLLCWHPQKGVLRNISFPVYKNPMTEKWHGWYREMFVGKEYIWLVVACDDRLLQIRKEDGMCELISLNADMGEYQQAESHYKQGLHTAVIKENEKVVIFSKWFYCVVFLDLQKGKAGKFCDNVKFPKNWEVREELQYIGKEKAKSFLLKGDNLINLCTYLKYEDIYDK